MIEQGGINKYNLGSVIGIRGLTVVSEHTQLVNPGVLGWGGVQFIHNFLKHVILD